MKTLLVFLLLTSSAFAQRVIVPFDSRYSCIVHTECNGCQGTAMILDSEHALTAAHCAPLPEVRLSVGPADVIAKDAERDWALLKLRNPTTSGHLTIRTSVKPGEVLYGFGYGTGGNRFGYIRGVFQNDCIHGGPCEPGDSGGPILDSDGALVGVVTGYFPGTTDWIGLGVGSEAFRTFVESHR